MLKLEFEDLTLIFCEVWFFPGKYSTANWLLQSTVKSLEVLRYWSTDPIQTKLFNDFAFFNTRESVLKRVINNGMTGSSWHFNRFLYINIKTIKVTDQLVR